MSLSPDRDRIDQLCDQFEAAWLSGQRPAIADYLADHPEPFRTELEQELRISLQALERTETNNRPAGAVQSSASAIPLQIGEYHLRREIGRGGMGVVYEAMQPALDRHVALKILPAHLLRDHGLRQRFEREAKAAGRLHHTNIVPVFDVGEADGQPFYVMQYIQGKSLEQYQADPRTMASIGVQIAQALDYAHRQGIIHRDIKPSNLLLDDQGTVWVTDFGLAKYDDQQKLTETGDVLGTVRYMPPEAFDGHVTAWGDIYSLGLTLYELVVGAPAYDSKDRQVLLKQVTTGTPLPLVVRRRDVPRDLATIIHKAIDREPQSRYATAGEMATDLQRFLNDEAILARRVSLVERLYRWARHHRAVATSLGVIALLLLIGMVASTMAAYQFRNLAMEREKARNDAVLATNAAIEREKIERWERYRSNIAAALSAQQLDNFSALQTALDSAPSEHRNWEWHHLRCALDNTSHVVPECLAFCPKTKQYAVQRDGKICVHVLGQEEPQCRWPLADGLWFVNAFSPDGRWLAIGTKDRQVHLWNVQTQQKQGVMPLPRELVRLTFNPNNKQLFCGLGAADDPQPRWYRWSFLGAHSLNEVPDVGNPRDYPIDLRPDGAFVLISSMAKTLPRPLRSHPRRVNLVDTTTLKVVHGHDGDPFGFCPDGRTFAVVRFETLLFCDGRTGQIRHQVVCDPHTQHFAWSDDHQYLATGEVYPSNKAAIWDVATGKKRWTLNGHTNGIYSLRFSSDSKRLLTASLDQTLRLWDVATGKLIRVMDGHRAPLSVAEFSPDGEQIVSFSDGEYGVRTWDGRTGEPRTYLVGGKPLQGVGFTDDSTTIYSAHLWFRETMTFWDRRTSTRTGLLRGHRESLYDVAFDSTGHQLASIDWNGKVLRWDADTEQLLATYDLGDFRYGRSVAFHPSGEQLAAVSISQRGLGLVAVIDRTSAKITDRWEYPADTEDFRACWHPNGEWLLSGGTKGFVHWHRPGQPTAERQTRMHEKPPWVPGHLYPETCADIVCSPDGKHFATAGYDRTARLGTLEPPERLAVLEGHTNAVLRVQFSPNGRWLASASTDGTVRIWDVESRTILATLPHGSAVYGLAFSPDGTRLASGCADSSIRLWDLATFSSVAQLRGHTNYVHAVAFSPDGKRLVSASGDKTIRLWETQRGTHPTRNAEGGARNGNATPGL